MLGKTELSRSGGERRAAVFAALGDPTRLVLLGQLRRGHSKSIKDLTRGSSITRQAVTKHLHSLEKAGLVVGDRSGRERRFQLRPARLNGASNYLQALARNWDRALVRLKLFVEAENAGASRRS